MTPRKCCICGIKCENFIEFYDPNQKLGKSLTYSVLDFCDEHRDEFYRRISEIAKNLDAGANLTEELCQLCGFFKKSGMIDEIYRKQGAQMPLTKCMECPRKNI